MHIRFLLGPAGSGKTFRCLAEIREALHANPEGDPLVFLAPKQATFQLERQLLADGDLPGYTRLHILSFERLARFVFQQLQKPEPELLQEEGRVMVLRALLERKRDELQVFRATARLPGFARQLSEFLRELQQHHVSAAQLDKLVADLGGASRLPGKLRDIGIVSRAYTEWLHEHKLQDADNLLDLATAELKQLELSGREIRVGGLWMDGFAQMTPQERELLAATIQRSARATLSFCLDSEPREAPPWHSAWAPVAEAFAKCRDELSALSGAKVIVEVLPRDPVRSRFDASPMLAHLEKHWTAPKPFLNPDATAPAFSSSSLRIVSCPNPEVEVEFAAREIRRCVRETGVRYRDTALLLRHLDGYHDAVRRVFGRYEIPFFLDRRESVAHHPLAELTRHALRIAAFGWEHEDWFAALKTGLVCPDDSGLDWLENEALARGWRGAAFWTKPIQLPKAPEAMVQRMESLRQQVAPPFETFCHALGAAGNRVSGRALTRAVRVLWSQLKVDRQLQRWNDATTSVRLPNPHVHETVWTQLLAWLENVERAFCDESFFLNEWLPIVEAGLGNLTVGVIPPALDQVLVGAVDRSRNPDLQLAFVLGMNEGVFPAPPGNPVLLNRAERETLADHNAPLGSGFLTQIGLERYYGYIACTRARSRLIVTFAERDSSGRELNSSVFISDLCRNFPALASDAYPGVRQLAEVEHWSEAAALLLQNGDAARHPELLAHNAAMAEAFAKWNQLARCADELSLPPELVDQIHGPELRTSVSALEDFAACPFRFFVGHGLRATERVEFEIDPREKGSFQHEILQAFHLQLAKRGKRWRDVTPTEARQLIRHLGESLLPEFKDGLFNAAQARRFTGMMLIEGLERLMETLIRWTAHYRFDPAVVEMEFGLNEQNLPGWRIDLDDRHALVLRGRIDRVDLCRVEETGETLAVVIDYKSSARELDRVLLDHGLQLQLMAYLGALEQVQSSGKLSAEKLIPAGAFYVALNGGGGSVRTRREEQDGRDEARRIWSRHRGRFDGDHLRLFDERGGPKGEQFEFRINKDGSFAKVGNEALAACEFQGLVRKVEEFLRQHGSEIYAGRANIAPFRYRGQTACDHCDYRPVCRFDPWTQPFRILKPATP